MPSPRGQWRQPPGVRGARVTALADSPLPVDSAPRQNAPALFASAAKSPDGLQTHCRPSLFKLITLIGIFRAVDDDLSTFIEAMERKDVVSRQTIRRYLPSRGAQRIGTIDGLRHRSGATPVARVAPPRREPE